MLGQLSGATRLFPIIGDPIKYVESTGPGMATCSTDSPS